MRRTLLITSVVFLSAVPNWAQTCSPKAFVTAAAYPSGPNPWAIATGDFTNDTNVDIAVANQYDLVSVLPGSSDGTFGSPILTSEDATYPYFAVSGFFDGDSNLDLGVEYYDGIRVYPGNGDGTFQPPNFLPTNIEPTGFVTADFNGDGKPDLAAAGGNVNVIRVFLGNGNGTFVEQTPVTGSGYIGALAAGDLDGGGTVDLVAATGNGVSLWPGLGNGSFGSPTPLKLGGGVNSIALGDLDDDGLVDIAAGVSIYAAVFHNNGNGTFLAAVEYPLSFPANRLSVADVDGDGRTDLVGLYAPQYYNTLGVVSVLLQQPNGTLGQASSFSAGTASIHMGIADFNGDGKDDVATTNLGDGTVSVLLATGEGNLRAIRVTPVPAVGQYGLASGDFDGDGLTDFMALDPNSGGRITFLRSDGQGHLEPGAVTVLTLSSPDGIFGAELNGDGKLDLVVTDYNAQVAILLGHGDGSFDSPVTYGTGNGTTVAVEGDFNGDGTPDLAVLDGASPNGDVNILLGLGGGAFVNNGYFPLSHFPGNLVAPDLNGDGFSDLVTSNGINGSQSVSVVLSNGDGSFQPPVDYPTASYPSWAASGDFNEDGTPDLVTSNSNSANLSVLLGNGTGGFQAPILVATGWVASSVETGDFDSDGHADILSIFGNQANRASLLRGTGNGTFQLPESYLVGSSPFRVFPGNFDFGPSLDAAVLNSDQTLSLLLNARLTAAVEGASVIVGSTAVLHVDASGFGTLTYQWRKDGVPLSDGGPISGATTATLTIDPVAFTDAGSYDVVVTDSCTSATSNAATLSVEFDDVPLSNPFHDDIITIATAGITSGCTGTSFCPSADVSRAEMAVFLLKSKFGASHVPPPPPPVPIFADVPASAFAAAWIDELATLGITGGCGNGNYCPDDPVTRGQMAVFLLKTLLGSGYVPPAATGVFSDVPSDYFAIDWIEDLYNRGITAGCGTGPLRYCPDQPVPREQMAAFLVRTFPIP